MKIKTILIALIACLSVSCSGGQKTVIKGNVAEGIDSVYIEIDDIDFSKTVAVVDGKFEVTTPVDPVAIGTITVGNVARFPFMLDGSTLVVEKNENNSYELNAEDKKSTNAQVIEYFDEISPKVKEVSKLYTEWYMAGADQTSELFAEVNAKQQSVDKEVKSFIDAHLSEAAILPVIYFYGNYNNTEFKALSEKMDPAFLECGFIASRLKTIAGIDNTKEGNMFVDFTIPDSDGKEVKFSDYIGKGKYVLVDFWASWCGPCRGEIPNLIKVYDKYKGEQFNVLGVAVWDKPEDSKAAAKKLGINYSEIINAQNIPTEAYGISGIPQIILFGPDGTILKRNLRGDAIEAEVAKYVKPTK